ncbi:hypothetical protein PHYBOEH_010210 [Phytophthora boehmeriae]|uniref:BTB domain-containing protein n=1 Tax=Phytophthora boehmeriae TaxID=109152 RepID=A0A8T1WZK5_9STRA|nr:hypothetical protein PHYBOEH_010210 [Phytophthora boehmeriae]
MSGNTPDHKQYSDDDVLAYPSDEDDQASSDFDGDISSSGDIRTLNDDMKLALSDEAWADVILLAEGRRIPVHRCMMIARSEYFRAVLSFQRSAMHLNADFPTTIAVEDSYAGIVRVLRFIYYDQVVLPQSADDDRVARIDSENGKSDMEDLAEEEASDQLLEDLVAADKYGLERMMRLCEHAVCVTEANCLEVLAVAELVHAAHLKQIAMRFVQTHLAAITARQEEFNRFQADFPHLLEELYGNLRFVNHEEYLLREWHRAVSTSWAAQREEMESRVNKTALETAFPWAPLSLAVAFGTIYLSMMNAQEHEYPYVPAANIVAIAAVGGAVFIGWL